MSWFNDNPWVGYADRSYLVMKQQILTKIQNPLTGIPEITDHNESNPFIKRVSIWCGINELLGYYIDQKAREVYLMTARLLSSGIDLAKQYDYRVRGKIASTGDVVFTLSGPAVSAVSIPVDTKVGTDDGIIFSTVSNATIGIGQTSVTVGVRQWEKVASAVIANSNGLPNQSYEIASDVSEDSITVLVDGVTVFTKIDTFLYSLPTNNHYKPQYNKNNKVEVLFGDGINGAIPANTKTIAVQYYKTLGLSGNVGIGLVTNILTTIVVGGGLTISVNNIAPTTNGKDAETMDDLRKYIPLSIRTLYRAVTEQDFIDVTELATGVAKAGVRFQCGKVVSIYIAPNGGGPASSVLINDVTNYLDLRRMVTTKVQVFSAGEVFVEHELEITAVPTAYNSQVQLDVIAALQEFYSVDNQKINGTVFIGDVYELLESVTGVAHSLIKKMRPIPYARPLLASYPALVWTRIQTTTSSNATYVITFVNPTQFSVTRNNVFMGTFNTGVLVNMPDVDFTITGTYNIGDTYEFKSYDTQGSIILDEPSLPAFNVLYLTITVTGGLV